MRPPVTNQTDAVINGNEHPRIDCSHLPDMARQEFKLEADINTIVNRFGLTGQIALRPPVFGERDFDIDLHTGFLAIEEAQRGFLALPRELRAKYRNPQGLLNAVHDGSFKTDLQEIPTRQEELLTRPTPPPAPVPVPPPNVPPPQG